MVPTPTYNGRSLDGKAESAHANTFFSFFTRSKHSIKRCIGRKGPRGRHIQESCRKSNEFCWSSSEIFKAPLQFEKPEAISVHNKSLVYAYARTVGKKSERRRERFASRQRVDAEAQRDDTEMHQGIICTVAR
jgi:hypothetical protein